VTKGAAAWASGRAANAARKSSMGEDAAFVMLLRCCVFALVVELER
jgi:hypothetical protein